MAKCLISLGANLGDRGTTLQSAMQQLATIPQTSLLAQSSFRETQPAGGPQQAVYLNAAATLETTLSPQHFFTELQRIENEFGRVRTERWGPRTMDLDLLLYDQLELETAELTLPHPRMSFRRFVLEPAAEIAAEMVYPINGWTILQLLHHLNRQNRLIVLRSTDNSAAELLGSLQDEPEVVAWFHTKALNEAALRAKEIELRKQRRLSGQNDSDDPPVPHWILTDFPVKRSFFQHGVETDQLGLGFPPNLVVVWQPKACSKLPELDRVRHKESSSPFLWIPNVPLEQARQEVIAAMAAME
jgi:2-amino-4-hydroxy-6-hydroxymethyldihydropteridine diphosphokinase